MIRLKPCILLEIIMIQPNFALCSKRFDSTQTLRFVSNRYD